MSGDNVFTCAGNAQFEMKRKASFSKLTGVVPRVLPAAYREEHQRVSATQDRLWSLMGTCLSNDIESIQRSIVNHVEYTLACTRFNLDPESCYRATACSVKDRLIESLNDTNQHFHETDVKRCYYMSLEYLLGRALQNALINLDMEGHYRSALADLGFNLDDLYEWERDPALGNGGLGRLAACFLDSMATINLPCWGYGLRYTYGIFEQKIIQGRQVENPDYWLTFGNPWEISRPDVTYAVRFYGQVTQNWDSATSTTRLRWTGGEIVQAMAYDNPIPGFDTFNTINLRLWKACPSKEFDFHLFNVGMYLEAIKERQRAEYISAVLYPNDSSSSGKELRLKQQYFFVCATIQDILRRFSKAPTRDWEDLPNKMAVQLNDTHPTIAIPEMMRILVDIQGLSWEKAWGLAKRVFSYTIHTVLPEALEQWPAGLLEHLLPRHVLIINEINQSFLNEVRCQLGANNPMIPALSIYQEGEPKKIRMANLAIIASHKVNGVAAVHTQVLIKDVFPHFVEYYKKAREPEKFVNMTNGVTPRRWIHCSNPQLSALISRWTGSDSWLTEFEMIAGLANHVDNAELRKEWASIKQQCKDRCAAWIEQHCGIKVTTNMLFDMQVKRIHEYKRQLMNCFYMIHRYFLIKNASPAEKEKIQPRATMVGGKAAPGYKVAKSIIRLACAIAAKVNNDPVCSNIYKIMFLPNYNVSNAQVLIPASDVSQHISTAGTEGSGTSNMKFVMNGGLILGTLDGANIEIREGAEDTMFIFGARLNQVEQIRQRAAAGDYPIDGDLARVFDFIRSGQLSNGDEDLQRDLNDLVNMVTNNGYGHCGDHYIIIHDFPDYVRAQQLVDDTYQNPDVWWKLSVKAAANMGRFSTDYTMKNYASVIWGVEPCPRPTPVSNPGTPNSSGERLLAEAAGNQGKKSHHGAGETRKK